MIYKTIVDYEVLNNFISWLPELANDETYYFSLLARNKYVRDLGIGTVKSDKHQCARWVANKDRAILKLNQTQCPIGSYSIKNIPIPQEALATYVTVNPRSHTKASKLLLKRMADVVADNEDSPNVYQESLTALHKAMSRKVFVDMDFDGVCLQETMSYVRDIINLDCITVLETRGGFHLLIRIAQTDKKYEKNWYKNFSLLPGVDIVGDNLIPVPGTYQGGFMPTMIEGVKFK